MKKVTMTKKYKMYRTGLTYNVSDVEATDIIVSGSGYLNKMMINRKEKNAINKNISK